MANDSKSSIKILIVDDKEMNIELIGSLLEAKGYQYTSTMDPFAVEGIIIEQNIDLILLDYSIPKRSGLEVLTCLRKNYSSLDLPIIMVTANLDEESTVKALKAGANDYVLKPISFEILSARIKIQLELMRLNEQNLKAQQIEALSHIVVTYNHEINNPLAVAMTSAELLEKSLTSEKDLKLMQGLKAALTNVRDKVKSIEEVKKTGFELTEYHGKLKTLKLGKK